MKRVLSTFLALFLLFCCFMSCNSAKKAPENTSEQISESQSESKSTSEAEESESKSELEENLERVYFSQEEIPGKRLEPETVFCFEHTDILESSSGVFRIFESKADLLQYIDMCDIYDFDSDKKASFLQAVEEVDFEIHAVIATVATYASGEEPLALDELILQDDRLVFVYESHFAGTTDQNEDHWSTLITVSKSELPNKELDGFICAYTYVDVDPNVFPVGSMKGSSYYFNYYEYQ